MEEEQGRAPSLPFPREILIPNPVVFIYLGTSAICSSNIPSPYFRAGGFWPLFNQLWLSGLALTVTRQLVPHHPPSPPLLFLFLPIQTSPYLPQMALKNYITIPAILKPKPKRKQRQSGRALQPHRWWLTAWVCFKQALGLPYSTSYKQRGISVLETHFPWIVEGKGKG